MNKAKKRIENKLVWIFILLICINVYTSVTYAATKAGTVILSKGDCYAIDSDKNKRILKRRSPIFIGDTLVTENNSNSQIRFIDNAVISLRENTSIHIDEYNYDKSGDTTKDSGVISLLKGGFRTITGAINQDNYKIQSEVASIGVRGTEYEVLFNEALLDIAAWNGSITVTNKSGKFSLGRGHKYNFASVSSFLSLPTGLLSPPTTLIPRNSPAFRNIIKAEDSNFNNSPKDPDAFNNSKSVFNPIQTKLIDTIVNQLLIANNQTNTTATTPEKQNDITKVNLDRVGMLVFSGANQPNIFGGKASSGSTGSPVITDNGYNPSQPDFYSAPANIAFWRNATTGSYVTSSTISGSEVSYGVWNNSTEPKAIAQIDPLGAALENSINTPVYWITAQATPATVISNVTGTFTYTGSSSSPFMGTSNIGSLTLSSLSITVDFGTQTISSGNLTFDDNDPQVNRWSIDFSGTIDKNVLNASIDTTASTFAGTSGVKGEIPMIFIGDGSSSLGVAGSFNVEVIGDPSNHAEGVFVADIGG